MAALGFRLLFLLSAVGSAAAATASGCSSMAFSSKRVYAACIDLPRLSSSLHWSYDNASATLSLAFVAPPAGPEGWVSWAINPSGGGMIGCQTLIAFRQPNGVMGIKTCNITRYGPVAEGPIEFETSDMAAEQSGGVMRLFAKMKLPAGMTEVKQVWQVGSAVVNGVPQKHDFKPENLQSLGQLNLIKGSISASGGGTAPRRNKYVHGILNAVSWGILLPIGQLFARYLKTFRSADPAWFYLHVSCQIIGYAVGVGGWATGLVLGSRSKGIQYTTHRNIGISLFTLCTIQVSALLLRPNKDHKYRLYWNIYHHSVGYTVIVLGIVNVFKGLQILNIDHKWTVYFIIIICILGGIALFLEIVTWIIVIKRRSDDSRKSYDGSTSSGVQRSISL
ncbi:cytochrome b561 and DOMON domain-containing protein At4g12980-like [Musa acuminata AAA Group]|uniref:cytochrome b561 and DOMON domain-containing protein At4g12980-like n=1 Tax=Musa acuminata AAA Group TaxID=214697 RepID=UPI0031E28ADB